MNRDPQQDLTDPTCLNEIATYSLLNPDAMEMILLAKDSFSEMGENYRDILGLIVHRDKETIRDLIEYHVANKLLLLSTLAFLNEISHIRYIESLAIVVKENLNKIDSSIIEIKHKFNL